MQSGSFESVARGLGVSPGVLKSKRLDFAANPAGAQLAIAREVARVDAKSATTSARLDSTKVQDAASAFVTSELTQVLTPVNVVSSKKFLFVPGRAEGGALLPVTQEVPLGKTEMSWNTLGYTGEARYVGVGGTALNSLTRPGTFDDQSFQGVSFSGVALGWNMFDLWRDEHLEGRDEQAEQRFGAREAMDDFFERECGFGNEQRKTPGFFTGGNVTTITLAKSFGDPSMGFAELIQQLSIIHIMWMRANGNRTITGVVMPASHRLNLLPIFNGGATPADGFHNAWKFALEAFPWLANIIEDDRLLTSGPGGAPIWQLYSADSNLLRIEGQATPMLFGPFEDRFETIFFMIRQSGGMVCRDSKLVFRINMPAPA